MIILFNVEFFIEFQAQYLSCGVVERPDHHCGDDLVLNCMQSGADTVMTRPAVPTIEKQRRQFFFSFSTKIKLYKSRIPSVLL